MLNQTVLDSRYIFLSTALVRVKDNKGHYIEGRVLLDKTVLNLILLKSLLKD